MKVSAWQGMNHVSSKTETSRKKKQNCFIFLNQVHFLSTKAGRTRDLLTQVDWTLFFKKIWFEDSASLKLQSGDAAST